MWKAAILKVEADPDAQVARVTFLYSSDDGRTVTVTERVSDPDSLTQIAGNAVSELSRLDAVASLIANPPLGDVDTDPPQPTEDDIVQAQYFEQRRLLIQMKQDLDLGLVTQDDYSAQLNSAVSMKPVTQIKVGG
jgi:hypothetical protein